MNLAERYASVPEHTRRAWKSLLAGALSFAAGIFVLARELHERARPRTLSNLYRRFDRLRLAQVCTNVLAGSAAVAAGVYAIAADRRDQQARNALAMNALLEALRGRPLADATVASISRAMRE